MTIRIPERLFLSTGHLRMRPGGYGGPIHVGRTSAETFEPPAIKPRHSIHPSGLLQWQAEEFDWRVMLAKSVEDHRQADGLARSIMNAVEAWAKP